MVKRFIVLVILVLGIFNLALAGPKANVYQTTKTYAGATASEVITFPYTIRDLVVRNDDATYPIWVGINRSSVTGWNLNIGTTEATLLQAGDEIDLYDTLCDYVALSKSPTWIGSSRVTVIASY